MAIPRIYIKILTRMFWYASYKISTSNKKSHKKKMKSTKTINKYPQPDLNQGCPDWKAGVLTTTLTVLADNWDNYIYPYR